MRVLLADDQVWLRSAIRLLLEQETDVDIVGEVGEVNALLAKAESMHPHLVLLDWELPGLKAKGAGQQLMLALRACYPCLHIIVLSGRPEAGRVALEAGADLYVSKADPPDRLLAAVHQIQALAALECAEEDLGRPAPL
jgi:DNA-binding NarL/FixJ family response regulator